MKHLDEIYEVTADNYGLVTTLKDGTNMADEDFERLADEAEKGIYPGNPGKWIVRPEGQPKLSEEKLMKDSFMIPESMME